MVDKKKTYCTSNEISSTLSQPICKNCSCYEHPIIAGGSLTFDLADSLICQNSEPWYFVISFDESRADNRPPLFFRPVILSLILKGTKQIWSVCAFYLPSTANQTVLMCINLLGRSISTQRPFSVTFEAWPATTSASRSLFCLDN